MGVHFWIQLGEGITSRKDSLQGLGRIYMLGMKVFVLLALASTVFAGVIKDEQSEYQDLSADHASGEESDGEYPEMRAAAAISSTDTYKEEETIKKQIDIKNSGRRPPYPQMPIPPNMGMPPPPPGYPYPGFPPKFGFDKDSKEDMKGSAYPQYDNDESAASLYEKFKNDMKDMAPPLYEQFKNEMPTPFFPPYPQNDNEENKKGSPPQYMMPLPEDVYEDNDDNNEDLNFSFDAAAPDVRMPGFPYPFPGPFPGPPPPCPNMCDLELYKKCTCKTPAMYTKDGRGNCNVGASKLDLRVWCYVDDTNGKPSKLCPDAKPSKSKPGYWWSRIACITG